MAVVERAEREVVVLVGVPLVKTRDEWVSKADRPSGLQQQSVGGRETYGISDGVSGFEGAGGRLMKVGCDVCDVCSGCCAMVVRRLTIVTLKRE